MKRIISMLIIAFLAIFILGCDTSTQETEVINYWQYMELTDEIKTIELLDLNLENQEVFISRYYEISETEILYFAPRYTSQDGQQRWNHYFYGYLLVETTEQEIYRIDQVEDKYLRELFETQINEET